MTNMTFPAPSFLIWEPVFFFSKVYSHLCEKILFPLNFFLKKKVFTFHKVRNHWFVTNLPVNVGVVTL